MKKTLASLFLIALLWSCNKSQPIVRESYGKHPSTADSSPECNRVIEYMPAPGQFINGTTLGFTGAETDSAAAAEYARRRLQDRSPVSLGGFGGYIVVGFDHSLQAWQSAAGGYDFSITGNQFDGCSEPGIVWVKQDVNGNNMPDEEEPWYELRGSEYGNEYGSGKRGSYSVTYFRPSASGEDVRWTDSEGNSGAVKRQSPHDQKSYYPAWRPADEKYYVLTGICLKPRDGYSADGRKYVTGNYDWGYADNFGNDMIKGQGSKTFFRIFNALDGREADGQGTSANLKYIDFIMVQTGINIEGGNGVGELSTEVCRFTDENLKN